MVTLSRIGSKLQILLYPQQLKSLLLSTKPLFATANEKVNNKTQARRPAYYIEYQTFGKKGLGIIFYAFLHLLVT
jgi:hypothetical protein